MIFWVGEGAALNRYLPVLNGAVCGWLNLTRGLDWWMNR